MKRELAITGIAALLLAGETLAQESAKREYPKTYTERVTPWYDPTGWPRQLSNLFSGETPPTPPVEKLPIQTATPLQQPQPSRPQPPLLNPQPQNQPLPLPQVQPQPQFQFTPTPAEAVVTRSPAEGGPAWKWYGYGTVTPHQNPHAPQDIYRTVPHVWHTQNGTTPGAMPLNGLPNVTPKQELTQTPLPPLPLNKPERSPVATPLPPVPANVVEMPRIINGTGDRKPILPTDVPSSPYSPVSRPIIVPSLTEPNEPALTMPIPMTLPKPEEQLPAVLTPPAIIPALPIIRNGNKPVEATPTGITKPVAEPVGPSATLKGPVAVEPPVEANPTTEPPTPGFGASLRRPIPVETPENHAPVQPAPTPKVAEPQPVVPAPVPTPKLAEPIVPAPAATPAMQRPQPQPAVPVIDRPDGAALPNNNSNSPDIPVEAAPGIVIPGLPNPMSSIPAKAYTARGQKANAVEQLIQQELGPIVRHVTWQTNQAITVVLDGSNIDLAWQARQRLSQVTALRSFTIQFEVRR